MPYPLRFSIALLLPLIGLVIGCVQGESQSEHQHPGAMLKTEKHKNKVTFVELGSVRCISCRKMQIVMDAIQEKYGDEVEVVFHDVITPDGKKYAKHYGINLIPTQVFLDAGGKEFFRHEGFLSEMEIIRMLERKGIMPMTLH